MADRFFDTSAANHYRFELGNPRVDAFLAEAGARHFLSALSVVELHSVFARWVRMRHITVAQFQLARGRFLADIAAGLWQILPVTDAHFHAAEQLLIRYGLAQSFRMGEESQAPQGAPVIKSA